MDAVVAHDNIPDWLIPPNSIFDGGAGKFGIPSLTVPQLTNVPQAVFLEDNDVVIGVKIGDVARAYPHIILDWHEIINDRIGEDYFAITYSPLTGSGIGWNRVINGEPTTFGVSGLLYNNNLIPYDRATDSYWSQMMNMCVAGPLAGYVVETIPVVETSWKTWREMYPQTLVVSTNTGYPQSYGTYPYGNYQNDDEMLLFPISNDDHRLPRKERVHGIIIRNQTRVYRFATFPDSIIALNDVLAGEALLVIGSSAGNFIVTYYRRLGDGSLLTFEPTQGQLPAVATDSEGNVWSIFGEALSGPRAGQRLVPAKSYNAYWFAWAAFFPEAEIASGY